VEMNLDPEKIRIALVLCCLVLVMGVFILLFMFAERCKFCGYLLVKQETFETKDSEDPALVRFLFVRTCKRCATAERRYVKMRGGRTLEETPWRLIA
jgi:hypothetical protein